MRISAKEFSRRTGFPLRLIRRMCRLGQLDHWQVGKVYLLDESRALSQLELYKARPPQVEPEPTRRLDRCRKGGGTQPPCGSGTERLRELIKNRKAAAAGTATAKDGGNRMPASSPISILS